MHFVFYNRELGRFDLSALTQYPILINLLTTGALFVEFALAFLLWFRATRTWMIFLGLALHVGVLFVVNVPLFGELMTACYLTFLTPQELDSAIHALNPWRLFRGKARTFAIIPGRVDQPATSVLKGPHSDESVRIENELSV